MYAHLFAVFQISVQQWKLSGNTYLFGEPRKICLFLILIKLKLNAASLMLQKYSTPVCCFMQDDDSPILAIFSQKPAKVN